MMQIKQAKLYFLVLGLMGFVVITALGGGLFGQQQPWFLQWQHQAFATLCHQKPERSFWINGQPMAVCSRCFGIYSMLMAGWALLPFLEWRHIRVPISAKNVLLAAFFINVVDVIGNLLGFWQNTLLTRFVLGGLMGSAAALLFSGTFFTTTTKKRQENYGRIIIAIARR